MPTPNGKSILHSVSLMKSQKESASKCFNLKFHFGSPWKQEDSPQMHIIIRIWLSLLAMTTQGSYTGTKNVGTRGYHTTLLQNEANGTPRTHKK